MKESHSQGPLNDSSAPLLKQRPFFLLFEKRVSCFLSSVVLYWRWQALELAFLAHQQTSTCRKDSFSRVRKLKLPNKRNVTADILPVPFSGKNQPTLVSCWQNSLKLNHFREYKNNKHSRTSVLFKETF